MALEGNAKDFGLSEIFQLISIQKKSGMLSIVAEENIAIFFQDGMIMSTRDRRNKSKDPLKDYLLRYGFIDRDEMNNLQQIQSGSNMDLTEILLSEKYFSEDELTAIFAEQIYESIHEVLSCPKSQYKFVIGKNVLSGIKSYASLKVEGVLMESMRRIDEFPEMRRIFPSEDMIFQKNPSSSTDKEPDLSGNEEVIYDLLQHERTLEYLVSHSRMARFCTYESLKRLLETGLLEFREAEKAEPEKIPEKTVKTRKDKRKRFVPTFAIMIILVASFAVGEYLVPWLMPPGWKARTSGTLTASVPETAGLTVNPDELRIRSLKATISQGLDEYYGSMGSYPFTLEVLAIRNFISGPTLELVQQAGIRYRMNDNGGAYSLQ
ncbi:MAG: DUF4388 domain-containing protein [Candidatus Krumholzibacteria bacterium]|nr:DUF4388 domain-containing protein [Candidatus Krumholzibacteria bacterium]